MDVVKISWSGGKDSTAATILHLRAGHKCKVVNYIPMFDEKTPLILKEHISFIEHAKQVFFKEDAELYQAHGKTYLEYFNHVSTKGKFKGKKACFPCILAGKCGFARASKMCCLSHIDVGEYDYQDIGIAYDEFDRWGQLKGDKRSILKEQYYTERDALELCKYAGLLSPRYIDGTRDGCALCPHAKRLEREKWFAENPHVIPLLKEMQEIAKIERPGQYPLRNYKWFLED